ncbi:MAG TPA: NADH-quinone oxidoreductase subunit M [Silvibacterium sp.]|nr:NADH-quinone oxidoreductase subunit M [Silvibacterium sp.]
MLIGHILTLTIFVPTAGAIVVALLPRKGRIVQWWTLLVSIVTFALTLHFPAHFAYGQTGFQFVENCSWIANPAIRYHLGLDGLSMWLIVLTGFLSVVGVLASWSAIETRTKEFYFFFLLQQTAMIGIFAALDIFLYYCFWELSLIPMAILIAIFGRERGPRTALKFFLYTFIPSALFLVAILWLYAKTGTFDYVTMRQFLIANSALFTPNALFWAALAFLVAFAVKVPVFPLHGWLGDTISDAPTAMAMVVAGKLGLYSILRFNLGLFPAQAREFAPWMIALAVIGILYGACIALVQTDIKRLIAYAILSALSFCTLGIFCFSLSGLDGAVYQFINEGVSGAALLALAGFLYERYETYDMQRYGGLAARLPVLATLFVITCMSLIGLPLFNGFVGEFLILSGSFASHHGWVIAATVGVILAAAYMLCMIQRIFYGPESAMVAERPVARFSAREHILLWPMAVLMLAMGVLSPFWIRAIDQGVAGLADSATHTISYLEKR